MEKRNKRERKLKRDRGNIEIVRERDKLAISALFSVMVCFRMRYV